MKNFTNRCCRFKLTHDLLIAFVFLLLLFNTTATSQWNTQSPVPTFLDVRGVGTTSAQRVFVATDDNSFDNGGALFESNDGGNTWAQLNIPFSLNDGFNGLFFLDNQNGWAFGNDNYKTTDGGTTWIQLPFLGSTYFMEFYTPTFGIATGNFGELISRDGGTTWVESPNGMFDFEFFDDVNGLGVSANGIFKSSDGGNTFLNVQVGNAEDVVYISSSIAIAIVDGTFIRSSDGGTSWNSSITADGKKQLVTITTDVVLAWGRTGNFPNYDDKILRSTNAGQTWTDLGEVIPEGIFALTVTNSQSVVAADFAGNMYSSVDAGLSWTQSFSSRGEQPTFFSSAVPAFSNSIGYFGYGPGFIIKSTDSGASWFQISSGSGQSLNDVDRFPNGNMIAVGDNGTLLTSNGTSPWIINESLTTLNLKAVQVLSPTNAVVVDESGRIYKSTNGGSSWTASTATPPDLSPAEDIHFNTLLDGWVIGQGFNDGVLYHTTDGGNSWIPVPDLLGAYVSVDVQGSNIWATNVTGLYYRSNDGGSSWIQGELPTSPLQIQDMDFYNESIGYAVGYWGYAFRSNDGGITWETLTSPGTDINFTDIHLIGPNELWISTANDVAYYSANGGQNWAALEIGSSGFGSFTSIIASPDGDAWTVGFQGYIEHFSGPPPPPLNNPPTASFEHNALGLTVNFTDFSTDPDGFIIGWTWDFGDGNSSTEQNPSHTFDTANTYIVRLTVTDDDSATGTTIKIIAVQPGPGGTFGDFTEVTPFDSVFVTPEDEDFWVVTTAPADYDSDGDLDVAVLGYYVVYNQSVEYRLLLIRNDGSAGQTEWAFSYFDISLGDITASSSDLSWGDLDGDSDQDLVVGSNGQTVLYRNDAGTLLQIQTNLPAYWEENDQADFDLRSITWADFDNDGDLDLLLPSVYNDITSLYYTALMRNDGANGTDGWTFTNLDSVFAPTTHAQSSWADFDGDLDLDLLLVNIAPLTDDGFIRRYRNEGNGTFTGEDLLSSLTVEHGEAQWGDYDSDGDLDILIAGNVKELDSTYTHMTLRIYRNDADSYVPFEVISCLPCEGWFDITAATWADYDSDGDMDILLAGTHNPGTGQIEGRAKIYINSNGIFTESGNELPAPRASGDRGGTFSWLDIDGEGDLDYFIAGQYFVPGGNGLVEAQMHVYRNDVEGLNNAPSSPTGLTAIVQADSSILLTWTPSSDDHTPAAAITYEILVIRKGTHTPPKLGELLDNPARLPQPGNISAVTEWSLKGLPDGQYEWRISAVDAAYIGSIIATGVFDVGIPTSVDPNSNSPREFSLEQNYPNPFNPGTVIKYSVPKEGLVNLKVYNAIGEEVASLLNEIKQAGNYELSFNASDLSTGIYFYRLQAGNFVQTRKMILLK